MKVDVLNIKGEKTGRNVELSDEIFGAEPNDHVIYLDVKRYLINQRQGNSKAKERNEISGSTRKLHKQKGTGGSRKGDINNPLFRGGGRIFGPKPRTYDLKLNKKVKLAARKSALAYKAKNNELMVVENFNLDTPKTKDFMNVLNALNLGDKKTLLVINDCNTNLVLSARNIPNAMVTTFNELNTYTLMNASTLLISEDAVASINETYKS